MEFASAAHSRRLSMNTYEKTFDFLAGTAVIMVGVAGIIINTTVIILIHKSRTFHNAFGRLCTSLLLAVTGKLLANIFWYVTTYTHLALAINRLLAIALPTFYRRIFSKRRVAVIIGSTWTASALVSTIFSMCKPSANPFPLDDKFKPDFFEMALTWQHRSKMCGSFDILQFDMIHGSILWILVIVTDIVTLSHLRKRSKRLQSTGNASSDELQVFRRNVTFFAQGCATSVMMILLTTSFNFFTELVSTRWGMFATTTITWEITDMLHGVIVIVFNKAFRDALRPVCLKASRDIVTVSVSGQETRTN
ncbi:hypothetical protein ANCCEY_13029 [Ancylostoma ceylanicum]|uniref:G-protein coupled receptors family 1 profile domain-containing protein n=1 Tax=Ancylostoma ceylanicum TaxID=53326 RepID=A0A0D6L9S6_9BILA|nr:hypothetical protein ANCCEY_13029 [Ancylostoma ceylanicum]